MCGMSGCVVWHVRHVLRFRCMHLAEGAQSTGQCHINTIDVHFMTNFSGQACTVEALYRLAAPSLLHSNPLVSLVISKNFDMQTTFPFRLRPVLAHDAQRFHDHWL